MKPLRAILLFVITLLFLAFSLIWAVVAFPVSILLMLVVYFVDLAVWLKTGKREESLAFDIMRTATLMFLHEYTKFMFDKKLIHNTLR